MTTFRYLFSVIFLVLSNASFAAMWTCEGSCDTSCFNGTLSRSGFSESAARSAMAEGCLEQSATFGCVGPIPPIINRCWEIGGGTPSVKQYNIVFRNNCNKHGKIWSAISYRHLDGSWQSVGYWGLEFGETARVATTTNRIFYTHAHTSANASVWGSGDTHQVIHGNNEPFSRQTISENYSSTTYTHSFTCN